MENICNFTNCKKPKVNTSNYCYCKSHYPSKEEYEVIYNNILSTFQYESINVNDYEEIKTFENGSCMYHAMVKFLIDNQDKHHIKNNKHFQNLTKEWYIKSESNSNIKDEVILTRRLQELLRSWIMNNLDKPMIECDNILVRDMVLISHDPYIESIEDYSKYYQIYAGDPDYIEESDTIPNVKKGKNKKKVVIPTRWGSIIEAYAFKELFQVNVHMYTKYKFVKRTLNVTICTDKERSNTENIYRYKVHNVYNVSNNIYDPEKNLYLVYLSSKNHYLYAKKLIPEID